MECRGQVIGYEISYEQNKSKILLMIDNTELMDIEELKRSGDCRIEIRKWRDKRSLNSNSYFHALSDKLADAMRMSKPKMKNYLLYNYGQKWRDDDGKLIVIKTNAPEDDVLSNKDFHCWRTKDASDGTPMYVLLRHSSSFDQREMSILIDGVIDECKSQGIETLPPQEVERLKKLWGEHE